MKNAAIYSAAAGFIPGGVGALGKTSSREYPPEIGDGIIPLVAVEQVRRMRGGAQAHLMRCSDDRYYVVKFQNNPQDRKILANELLGTSLARLLRLPTAAPAVVYVREELINLTPELCIELPRKRISCQPGLQFGSRFVGDLRRNTTLLPPLDSWSADVRNLSDFAGMLVFDKWTCNTDGRQVVLQRSGHEWRAVMIDQGFCFNAGEWNFPDAPLRGRYYNTSVYDDIRSINDFDPWLDALESEIDEQAIWNCASEVPLEWYDSDRDALARLVITLNRRRRRVKDLLWDAQRSSHDFLRNWIDKRVFAAAN